MVRSSATCAFFGDYFISNSRTDRRNVANLTAEFAFMSPEEFSTKVWWATFREVPSSRSRRRSLPEGAEAMAMPKTQRERASTDASPSSSEVPKVPRWPGGPAWYRQTCFPDLTGRCGFSSCGRTRCCATGRICCRCRSGSVSVAACASSNVRRSCSCSKRSCGRWGTQVR